MGTDRVTFANFTGSGGIPWSALGFLRNNGFSVSTGNFAGDVEFVSANQYYLETPHADKDGDKAAVFLDRDGDVTGAAGAYVVPNHPFLVTPSCTLRAEWNAYVCTQRYVGPQRAERCRGGGATHDHPRRRGGAHPGWRS